MSPGLPFTHGRDQVISYPVTAAGIRTRVVESLDGTHPLVCLHGVGSRADRFIPVVPGLVRAGFHVYVIDFPGHGFADKRPEIDYRARGFAEFVAAVLDTLGLANVTVAGTSLGGHVAARLACDRPDLVSNLVLIGTMGISKLAEEDKVAPGTSRTAASRRCAASSNSWYPTPRRSPMRGSVKNR